MANSLLRAFVFVSLATSLVSTVACSDDTGAVASPTSNPTPAPTPTQKPPTATKDIVDTALGAGTFKTLAAALTKAGLVETLKGAGPFTVFAPTDAAFAKLGDISGLTAEQLAPILTYHVYKGAAKAADVVGLNGQIVKTVNAEADLAITIAGKNVILNNGKKRAATVTQTDIVASNGIIHVLDTVLDPADKPVDVVDTAIANGNFKTLAAAATKADLVAALKGAGPFTVFAPTDKAFEKLGDISALTKAQLGPILSYHVLPGKTIAEDVVKASGTRIPTLNAEKKVSVTVKDGKVLLDYAVQVTTTDIIATNGVVHVINNVLTTNDIVDVVVATPDVTTLKNLVVLADLAKDLKADGPFTVFAPTDDAFALLDATLVSKLSAPENTAKLKQVLTYHVLGAAVPKADVVALDGKETPIATLEGLKVKVNLTGGMVFLNAPPAAPVGPTTNNAQVTATDILTRNGIIHKINRVLVPSNFVAPQ